MQQKPWRNRSRWLKAREKRYLRKVEEALSRAGSPGWVIAWTWNWDPSIKYPGFRRVAVTTLDYGPPREKAVRSLRWTWAPPQPRGRRRRKHTIKRQRASRNRRLSLQRYLSRVRKLSSAPGLRLGTRTSYRDLRTGVLLELVHTFHDASSKAYPDGPVKVTSTPGQSLYEVTLPLNTTGGITINLPVDPEVHGSPQISIGQAP